MVAKELEADGQGAAGICCTSCCSYGCSRWWGALEFPADIPIHPPWGLQHVGAAGYGQWPRSYGPSKVTTSFSVEAHAYAMTSWSPCGYDRFTESRRRCRTPSVEWTAVSGKSTERPIAPIYQETSSGAGTRVLVVAPRSGWLGLGNSKVDEFCTRVYVEASFNFSFMCLSNVCTLPSGDVARRPQAKVGGVWHSGCAIIFCQVMASCQW